MPLHMLFCANRYEDSTEMKKMRRKRKMQECRKRGRKAERRGKGQRGYL
jgi:hypothetical protein